MKQTQFTFKKGGAYMSHQNTRLKEALDDWYGQLSSQMAAPFYLLSNAFLTAGNLSADMMGAREKTVSNGDERGNFTIETADIPLEVSSFLKEKQQANELQDYVVRLIQQDLQKMSKENEVETLVHSLRKELLGEIDLLKKELGSASAPSYKQLKPVKNEEEETFKEGQLIKSEKVTGTIQEDIDVDF